MKNFVMANFRELAKNLQIFQKLIHAKINLLEGTLMQILKSRYIC